MKSPADLAAKLSRDWHNAGKREQRLLGNEGWPLDIAIGKPRPTIVETQHDLVREHVRAWRAVTVGQVQWQEVRFRSTDRAIMLPMSWQFANADEWIVGSANHEVQREYQILQALLASADAPFHRLLIRQRPWLKKSPAVVELACELANALQPGCLNGAPLRALAHPGIDSKFCEQHARLLERLLDIRFNGAASPLGLARFLDAADDSGHWLLIADLDGTLLPYQQLRLRHSELLTVELPGKNLLLVENERCLHQLPAVADTVAVLGCGLNLTWLAADWLADKNIGYWGDIDTWGLQALARARQQRAMLTPLLMTRQVFELLPEAQVLEPSPASSEPPSDLLAEEQSLYRHLLAVEKGRVEQERLPQALVEEAMRIWWLSLS